ncbi:hypothetical protein Tco_0013953 [Tanacetum coccineum]
MKRVNTFTLMESDDTVPKVIAGSSKRDAEQELNQEILGSHEKFNSTEPTKDKERELWVDLKRLFEPDDDILWKLQRSNKLQVDEYSVMADELLRKIFILANRPRQ